MMTTNDARYYDAMMRLLRVRFGEGVSIDLTFDEVETAIRAVVDGVTYVCDEADDEDLIFNRDDGDDTEDYPARVVIAIPAEWGN